MRKKIQSSYEIVKRAIFHDGPERLPVKMGSLGISDTLYIPCKSFWRFDNNMDEWGCHWEQTETTNMGQVKGHPLNDYSEYEKMIVPDYSKTLPKKEIIQALKKAEAEQKYTETGIFMILFERMQALVGFENALTGLILDRENAEKLADKIVDIQIGLVKLMQETCGNKLHSFTMTDDWGTQQAAYISIELWRDFFLPRYKKIFDVMHKGGQDVWVHSCGKVNEIIEGYIEAGVNVVNLQQPRALGIEEIGRRYRGRIAFESLADIQVTLPKGDKTLIEQDARDLSQHWMSPKGGFILSDYGDGKAIGTTNESKKLMYDAFSRISEAIYGNPLPAL
ncbi:MAG TPA: uroporphyrinogen decarboxylase family protein [Victivallales bacterium]|nr:uroporphyrinogen decarboxylase family protein [Victivallales bacterium]HRR28039.1 uroporphyrinogen decarboxylase family protein [Victivallales bacterium]